MTDAHKEWSCPIGCRWFWSPLGIIDVARAYTIVDGEPIPHPCQDDAEAALQGGGA